MRRAFAAGIDRAFRRFAGRARAGGAPLGFAPRLNGGVGEWLNPADCKSARFGVRWFESTPLHHHNQLRKLIFIFADCHPRALGLTANGVLVHFLVHS